MTNRQKQNLLQYLDYYKGIPDDIWGDKSRSATEAFQRDYQLTVDGIFGNATADRILEVIASGEHPQTQAPAADPEDAPGETGTFWDHIRYFTREEFRCTCGGRGCNGFPAEPAERLVRNADAARKHFGSPAIV